MNDDNELVESNAESTTADVSNAPTETEVLPELSENDKFQVRINQATREKHDARREAKEAKEEVARLTEQLAAGSNGGFDAETVRSFVAKEAANIASQTAFDNQCNAIFDAGVKEFEDFGSRAASLNDIGMAQNKPFFDAILDADNSARLIYELAGNLDEAERIMNLPTSRMIRELTKLELSLSNKPKPTKPVSNAPAPLKTLDGKSPVSLKSSDTMSDEEYSKWRKSGRK